MPRYDIHDYSRDETLVDTGLDEVALLEQDYVTSFCTLGRLEDMRVGDEQLSDMASYYIRRVE